MAISISNPTPADTATNVPYTSKGVFCSFYAEDTEGRTMYFSAQLLVGTEWVSEIMLSSMINGWRFVRFSGMNESNTTYQWKIRITANGDVFEQIFTLTTGDPTDYDFISPDSFIDPDEGWINEIKAFDNDASTWAHTGSPTKYIYFMLDQPITCDGVFLVAVALFNLVEVDPEISCDAYYDGTWNNIFSGTIGYSIPAFLQFPNGTETVNQIRIKITNISMVDGGEIFEIYFRSHPLQYTLIMDEGDLININIIAGEYITGLVYPTSPINPGESFIIEYDVTNIGSAGHLWGALYTGENSLDPVSPTPTTTSFWYGYMDNNSSAHKTLLFSAGLSSSTTFELRVGHETTSVLTLYENNLEENVANNGFTDAIMGQTFTPSQNHIITSVKFKLAKTSSSLLGPIVLSFRKTLNNMPTGDDLVKAIIDGATLPVTTPAWVEFNPGFLVYAGVKYAVLLDVPLNTVDTVIYKRKDPGPYAGGNMVQQTHGGSWASLTGDITFQLSGYPIE